MEFFHENNLPIPNCWRPAWQRFAREAGFERFPTRRELLKDPVRARRFTQWIWGRLLGNDGYMCSIPNTGRCDRCQKLGVSKLLSLYVLSVLVRQHDGALHHALYSKFSQLKEASAVPAPDGDPLHPVVVGMPIPESLVFTNVIAREQRRCRWWLDEQ